MNFPVEDIPDLPTPREATSNSREVPAMLSRARGVVKRAAELGEMVVVVGGSRRLG
jgi:hypothetical protein